MFSFILSHFAGTLIANFATMLLVWSKFTILAESIIVEPGVILDNLNKELAKHNLFFPVIPASHKVCTIGGMISTNAAGMRAIRYGKTLDWTKELEIIDGMGRVMTANDKNINHFCGREGTTGIIIKAKLNLTELT